MGDREACCYWSMLAHHILREWVLPVNWCCMSLCMEFILRRSDAHWPSLLEDKYPPTKKKCLASGY